MNPGELIVPAIRLPGDYGRLGDLAALAREAGVPGFVVFGGDAELTPPFLRRLREAAERPLLFLADYERGAGGMVRGLPELPPAMAVGATGRPEAGYMAGKITALSARALSVNVVLAPVLDVLSRPDNPIVGDRAFSDDPAEVTRFGLAFLEGVREEGVMACAKHFPGHGDTRGDSHTELPRVGAAREVLEAREFPPFRAAVRAGVDMVMTAHVDYAALDPGVPATFSPGIVGGLLKEEWGYGGIVITDALTMEGARGGGEDPCVRALAAGADLCLCPADPRGSIIAIERALAREGLSESALILSAGKVRMAAADQVCEAPVRRDLSREYQFEIESIARSAISAAGDPREPVVRASRRGEPVLGLVLDDDGMPGRARAFRPREEEFDAGVVHVTREGTGTSGDLAARLRNAGLVVMGLFGSIRAGKGRAGLSPPLRGFAAQVLEGHGAKTVTVVFGPPVLAAGLPPGAVVFAYGDAEVVRRAALDALFEGAEMGGRPPGRGLRRSEGGEG